ncbi:MAG: anti-sigma factor [Cryobacterium sp.]|uniref:anti-sigma factor domain-containing protein n=1 Tax=Cryobacterium sp. TaxID=1926290 RepID=UPI0022947040|nr:anti-sigma factor [Cryobacterium sp.]MCY7405488.1 anti-sigma factor [Cryobacterium sp.]
MTPINATHIDAAHIDAAHIDAADLHLLALVAERDASARERAHLAACAACAGEYLALRQVVQLGRAAGFDRLLTPPAAVWASIRAELGLSDAVRTVPRLSTPPHLTDTAARPDASGSLIDGPESATPPEVLPDSGSVREIAPVRLLPRRRWVPVAAAAGVIGLVGGIAIGVASTTGGSPREQVVAEATLDALPGWTAGGSARVEQASDGRRAVVVDLDAPASSSTSLREVWLLKADASGLVSIGFLDGSTGRFTIPASVDLAQYPIIDVSAEPTDGDPAHSGDSIVRGQLHAL